MTLEERGRRLLENIDRYHLLWALLIIGISTGARYLFIVSGQLNLVQDEAQYWDWSRRLQLSYYSKGPLIAWLNYFWTNIFGNTEFGVRVGSLVNGCAVQCILYAGVTWLFKRPRLAVLTLIVANTAPLFNVAAILMTTDNPMMVCWLITLFALYYAVSHEKSVWPLVLIGICMMLGNLAKYMMLYLLAVGTLYLLILYCYKLISWRYSLKIMIAMGIGAVLGYLPILIWNIQNDWVAFRHVFTLAGIGTDKAFIRWDTTPEFLAGQFGIMSPWWMALMLIASWLGIKALYKGTDPDFRSYLSRLTVRKDHKFSEENVHSMTEDTIKTLQIRQNALLVSGFLPLWITMFFWSFHVRIYPNWSGMSFVAGMILAAVGLERLLLGRGSRLGNKYAVLWPIFGTILMILTLCIAQLPLPAKLDPSLRLKGWEDMGNKLQELVQQFPDPQKVFYFADHYDVTAELAFYAPGQPFAYSADFGRRRSQYDLWPTPVSPGNDLTGWDAIYVTTSDTVRPQLGEMFEEMKIVPFNSLHNGKPGRSFNIVLLHNFNGHWPQTALAKY